MIFGLFCGALLALWLPLPWVFLTAVCGDTAFLLRAYAAGALAGAALAFGATQAVSPAKRPHGAVLSMAFVFIAGTGVFPLMFTDSIFDTWQNLLFQNAGPDRVLFMTRAWGVAMGFAAGLAAGFSAALLPAPRVFHLPALVHLLLGAVAARALSGVLPAPHFEVSLRASTILLAAFAAAAGSRHAAKDKPRQRRLAAGVLSAAAAFALAALMVAIPARVGVPLEQTGPFGYWAAPDHGFLPVRGAIPAPVSGGRLAAHAFAVYDAPINGGVVVFDAMPFYSSDRFRAPHALAAAIPFLRAPHARRAVFAGEFAARAAVAAQALPLREMEVWEPVPKLFEACGGVVPGHVVARVGSGRAALRRRGAHDIVVVDPGPLWRRGALDWLAPPALRRLRASLAENGIAAARLDGRGLTPLLLQRVMSDFMDAGFDEVCLWQTGVRDFLLTGGAPGPGLEAAADVLRDHAPLYRELAHAGVHGLPGILSTLLMDHDMSAAYVRAETAEPARRSAGRAWRALFDPLGAPHLLETLAAFQARGLSWTLGGDDARELGEAVAARTVEAIAARLDALPVLRAHAANDLSSAVEPLLESRHGQPRLPLLHDLGDRTELTGRQAAAAGDHALAAQHFYITQLLRPASWAALLDYAQALRKLNQNEEAHTVLARAAALAPGLPVLRFEKAGLALMLQKWGEARDDYQTVLMDDPQNIVALASLARLLARADTPLRDIGRAVELAERAAKITAFKDPLAVITLGDIYILAGRAVDGVKLKQAFRSSARAAQPE